MTFCYRSCLVLHGPEEVEALVGEKQLDKRIEDLLQTWWLPQFHLERVEVDEGADGEDKHQREGDDNHPHDQHRPKTI